jgi:hypothetical protein
VTEQWRKRDDVLGNGPQALSLYSRSTPRAPLARFDAWQKRYGRIAFPLFPDADQFVISYVRENWMDYPELKVETHLRRRYPGKDVAAHVFGYVGEVTPDRSTLVRRPVRSRRPGGKAGSSVVYEDKLTGIPGQRAIEVTASGQSLGEVSEWSTTSVARPRSSPRDGFPDAGVPRLAPAPRPNPSRRRRARCRRTAAIIAAVRPPVV